MSAASLATMALFAIGLAIQPWSVLAAIVLVATRRGVIKEIAYTLGWVIALSVVAALTVYFASDLPSMSSSKAASAVELVLGALLALLLVVRWRRPVATRDSPEPSWMSRLDKMPWVFAFALGAFLPNYVFVVGGVTEMLQVDWAGATLLIGIAAFVCVASLGVAAPLGVLVFRHGHATEIYASWRAWIIGHSRAVSFGTIGVLAVLLLAKGLVGLI